MGSQNPLPTNLTTTPEPDGAEAPRPWDQRPDEGRKAYDAFLAYRDMDTGRGYTTVAQKLHKSRTLIKRWASRHRWQERLRAWLAQADAERERQARLDLREMAERDRDMAVAILRKCTEAVGFLNPRDISPRDLGRLIDIAIRIERTSYGVDGSLHMTTIEQLKIERPEGDVISEAVKALSPVDRELLRVLSLKQLRIVELRARIAARAALPEALKENTENPDG